MGAIYKRELKGYFTSPIGYVILAIFYVFASFFFSILFESGTSDQTQLFSSMFVIVLIVIPLLTMRIFSEDKRQKTDQLLYTAPVSLTSVVIGKYLAAMTVFGIALGITVIFQIITAFYVTPDWMVYIGNLLGMLLLASAMISIGVFISALTESQLVAAVASFAVSMVLWLIDTIASIINITWVTTVVNWISFNGRYNGFTQGTFDYANMIFFLSFTALFLFLTVRVLDRKRYA